MEISSFYTGAPKIMIIWYTVSKIWSMTDVIVSFWDTFCPFTPPPFLTAQKNDNFKKMKKKLGDIIILDMCTKNYD